MTDMSHILIRVVVTWGQTFVKTHQIISLESVQFAVIKFYHKKKRMIWLWEMDLGKYTVNPGGTVRMLFRRQLRDDGSWNTVVEWG